MAPQIVQAAAKQGVQQVQSAARSIAQGHLETLKNASRQVGLPTPEARPTGPDEDFVFDDELAGLDQYQELKAKSEQDSKAILKRLEAEVSQMRARRTEVDSQRREEAQAIYSSQNSSLESETQNFSSSSEQKKGLRGAIGAFARKVTSMTSKAEKQRNVSG